MEARFAFSVRKKNIYQSFTFGSHDVLEPKFLEFLKNKFNENLREKND